MMPGRIIRHDADHLWRLGDWQSPKAFGPALRAIRGDAIEMARSRQSERSHHRMELWTAQYQDRKTPGGILTPSWCLGGENVLLYPTSDLAAVAMSSTSGTAFFSSTSLKAMGTFLPATRLMGPSR